MRITAVTRLKWGVLFDALQRADWTAAELARRVGTCPTQIGLFLNLQKRPTEYFVRKIEAAFIQAGINIDLEKDWPVEFEGFKGKRPTIVQTRDIPAGLLLAYEPTPSPLELAEKNEEIEQLTDIISKIPPRFQKVINCRFGINGEPELTLEEIAKEVGVTRERVRQMEHKAIRYIQGHSRSIRKQGLVSKDHEKYLKRWRVSSESRVAKKETA
mgnify:CR=1 FL=1